MPCHQTGLLKVTPLLLPDVNQPTLWQGCDTPPKLREGQVHLWQASTESLHQPFFDRLARYLDPVEQGRAARFYREVDRIRFTLGRGLLRYLLSGYVDRPAQTLRFDYGPQGKPELVAEQNTIGLSFNLSHSGSRLLYAVALHQKIGVDIESIREVSHCEQIARRFFSHREAQALLALPAQDRQLGFFCIWTRKEAFIKARGDGLSFPLDRFEVLHASQITLLNAAGEPEKEGWPWRTLYPGAGYTAALVADREDLQLSCWAVKGLATCEKLR